MEHVELDAVNWQENWISLEPEVFQKRVASILDANKGGWVVDGSYHERLGELVRERADTILFLNIPLIITVPRVIKRSIKRVLSKELLWGKNRETLKGASYLVMWTVKYHRRRVKKMEALEESLLGTDTKYIMFRTNAAARKWLTDDAK